MAAFVRLASASQVFCPHLRATLLQHYSLGCPWAMAAQFNRRVLRGLRDPSPPQGTRRRGRAAMCGENGKPPPRNLDSAELGREGALLETRPRGYSRYSGSRRAAASRSPARVPPPRKPP